MTNQQLYPIFFLCLSLLTGSPGSSFSQDTCKSQQLEEYIDSTALSSAFWGIVISDVNTDECLLEYNPHKNFIPASVTKLFTTTSALMQLGSDYRFSPSSAFCARGFR